MKALVALPELLDLALCGRNLVVTVDLEKMEQC
jgi:hypothetical protein